jgi:tetratricopeptide (TPR) repeat protein
MKNRLGALIALAALVLLAPAAVSAAQDTSLDQAGALVDKHDYKGAIAILDRLLTQDPKNVNALVMRGDAKDDLGDHNGALDDYNAAIEINPDYEYAYATRCGTHLELSHTRAAVNDCTKALSLKPKDDMALRERSAAYYFLGDYQLAAADAQAAMDVDNTEPGNILANCRAAVGMLRDDVKDCSTYISYQPNDADGYFYRGRIYLNTSSPAQAKDDFHKALQLDNTYTAAHYWLAEAALELGAYNESVSESDAFLAQYPSDADTLLLRAKAEVKLGHTDAARIDGNAALQQYRIQNDSDGEARVQTFLKGLDKP